MTPSAAAERNSSREIGSEHRAVPATNAACPPFPFSSHHGLVDGVPQSTPCAVGGGVGQSGVHGVDEPLPPPPPRVQQRLAGVGDRVDLAGRPCRARWLAPRRRRGRDDASGSAAGRSCRSRRPRCRSPQVGRPARSHASPAWRAGPTGTCRGRHAATASACRRRRRPRSRPLSCGTHYLDYYALPSSCSRRGHECDASGTCPRGRLDAVRPRRCRSETGSEGCRSAVRQTRPVSRSSDHRPAPSGAENHVLPPEPTASAIAGRGRDATGQHRLGGREPADRHRRRRCPGGRRRTRA